MVRPFVHFTSQKMITRHIVKHAAAIHQVFKAANDMSLNISVFFMYFPQKYVNLHYFSAVFVCFMHYFSAI